MSDFGVNIKITNNTGVTLHNDAEHTYTDGSSWETPPPALIESGTSVNLRINDDEASRGARGQVSYFGIFGPFTFSYDCYGSCPVMSSNGAHGPGIGGWSSSGHPLNLEFTFEPTTVPSRISPTEK
jgi:hypothetical protein